MVGRGGHDDPGRLMGSMKDSFDGPQVWLGSRSSADLPACVVGTVHMAANLSVAGHGCPVGSSAGVGRETEWMFVPSDLVVLRMR